jgi:ribosomal protein L21E
MMKRRNRVAAKRDSGKKRQTRPLQVEQLEARLMNAIDTIELGLEAFSSSHLQSQSNKEIAGEFGFGSTWGRGLSNQTPVIVSPISFSTGSIATGNTARASVLAFASSGEQGLIYRWSVVRAPSGSNPIFSANNTNAAKNITLSFDRAGEYEIMATAVGRTGLTASFTSRLTVSPTLTSLRVISADGRVVNPNLAFNTATIDPAFRVQGLDQFGQVMQQSISPTWTMRTGPANGRMTPVSQGEFTRFQFSHFDQFGIQATVGDKFVRFTVQNVRATARMDLLDASGGLILNGTTVPVSSDRSIVTMRVFDQSGNIVASPTNVLWTTQLAPTGGTARVTMNGTQATIIFNRVGTYDLLAQANGVSRVVRFQVNPVLTSLALTPNSASVQTGQTRQFAVQGLDQFGAALATSPAITWTASGGTISTSGLFTAGQTTGPGSVTAASGAVRSTVQLTITAPTTTTTLQLRDAAGNVLSDVNPVTVTGTQLRVDPRIVNSTGGIVNSAPIVAMAVTLAPTNGNATFTMSGSTGNVVFTRAGSYDLNFSSGGMTRRLRVTVNATLTSLQVSPSSVSVQAGQTRQFTAAGFDQFGQALATAPTIAWTATGGTVSSSGLFTAGQTAGAGSVRATSGSVSSTMQLTVTAPPTATNSLQLRDASGNVLSDVNPVTVSGTLLRVDPRIVNSTGGIVNSAPTVTMSTTSAPSSGVATFSMSGSTGNVVFTRAGSYDLNFTSSGMTRRLRVTVSATLTSLQVTPGTASVQTGQTRQFTVAGLDQFGQTMASSPTVTWTATGGTVSSSGLFTASTTVGSGSVRATAGALSATAAITVTAPSSGPFQNAALSQLVQTYYVDQMLSRTEVMAILRSVGSDSVVDSVELNDLRTLVNSTQYVMPAHVRGLARNTVTDNPANLRFQGQAAGNLTAGSSSTLLNRLVDKWFLGTDLPTVTVSSLAYSSAVGTLFNVGPSLADVKQGMVGDCYFLAAAGSIASRNQQAIRDIFDDNGDGTFTVRFFGRNSSGVATPDYVTVDRRLPTYSGVYLYYAGYGFTSNSPSTVLWVALAEKAYAQWNETGRAGRDGTNSYAGIEGGWMSNVNFQILGYNSTNYSFTTTTQQTLINAIGSGQAVTAGTKATVASGLVATHAYSITAYNSSTGRFTLHNPWGNTHPAPLTWGELQANFSMFTTTAPQGSGGEVVSSGFRSQLLVRGELVTAPTSLAHRLEIGLVSSRSEQLQRSAGCEAEWIAMAWLETDPSTESSALEIIDLPSDVLEEASDDIEIEGDATRNRVLKDLALMDLYISMASR